MLTEPRNSEIIKWKNPGIQDAVLIGVYKMWKDFSDYLKIKFAWIRLNDFADFHNKCSKHFSYGI